MTLALRISRQSISLSPKYSLWRRFFL
jgi:hypothetical protein